MKTAKLFCLNIISLALVACGGSSGSSNSSESISASESIKSEYQGVWNAPAYGVAYKLKSNSLNRYSYTSDYCLLELDVSNVSTRDVEQEFAFNLVNDEMINFSEFGTKEFHAPALTFKRQAQLPASCINDLVKTKSQSGYQKNNLRDFRILYQMFDEYYVDFELKGVDWEALYQTYLPEVHPSTSDEKLLDVMNEMFYALSDAHVNVVTEYGSFTHLNKNTIESMLVAEFAEANSLPFPIPTELLTATSYNQLLGYIENNKVLQRNIISEYAQSETDIESMGNGIVRWFKNDGIGYVAVNQMHGLTPHNATPQDQLSAVENMIDSIVTAMSDTSGLIIDLRENGGGTDLYSLAIASRFVTGVTHIFSKQARLGDAFTESIDVSISPRGTQQFLADIVVLTSAKTASAAEKLVLALRALPNVTIVGEPTQGALSYRLEKMLPNGFEVSLSNEKYLSHDGQWYEHTGIPVDVSVPYSTLEQRQQGVDLGLEAAIAILNQ